MINKSLADSCRSNYALNPFPHIVIDDFIPEDLHTMLQSNVKHKMDV